MKIRSNIEKYQYIWEKVVINWTPGRGRKGPMNSGLSVLLSFCPSVLPSRSFLGIGSLVFLETQHGLRGPCGVVHDRAWIFGKNFFWPPKWGK